MNDPDMKTLVADLDRFSKNNEKLTDANSDIYVPKLSGGDFHERLICAALMRVETTYYGADQIALRAINIASAVIEELQKRRGRG